MKTKGFDLSAKGTALITGASSGIGQSFADKLAERGYDLVLVARREAKLQALADTFQQGNGVSVQVVKADLSTQAGIEAVASVISALPRLDLLINNAGFGVADRFTKSDIRRQQAMVDVHISATTQLCHAAIAKMQAQQRGAIINVSSLMAFMRSGSGVYAATKSYLNAFSLGLQLEVAKDGIQVQALCPGLTRTGFHFAEDFEGFDVSQYPKFIWMEADAVAQISLQSLGSGKVVVIPGLLNKLIAAIISNPLVFLVVRRVVL